MGRTAAASWRLRTSSRCMRDPSPRARTAAHRSSAARLRRLQLVRRPEANHDLRRRPAAGGHADGRGIHRLNLAARRRRRLAPARDRREGAFGGGDRAAVHVAHDHDGQRVSRVGLREAGGERGARQRGDRSVGPQHRPRVAVAREGGREQLLQRAPPRIGGGAGDLVERQLARPLDLRGIEVGIGDRVGQHIEAELEERRRDDRVIDGFVEAGPRAHAPLHRLQLAERRRPAPIACRPAGPDARRGAPRRRAPADRRRRPPRPRPGSPPAAPGGSPRRRPSHRWRIRASPTVGWVATQSFAGKHIRAAALAPPGLAADHERSAGERKHEHGTGERRGSHEPAEPTRRNTGRCQRTRRWNA